MRRSKSHGTVVEVAQDDLDVLAVCTTDVSAIPTPDLCAPSVR